MTQAQTIAKETAASQGGRNEGAQESPPSSPSSQEPVLTEEQIKAGTPSGSQPIQKIVSSTTPAPSTAVPPVKPEASPKAKEKKPPIEKEERVKQARALLDQQVKEISKRENIPENIIRMELYLEARMRKTILPKIDRLDSEMREALRGIGEIGKLLLRNGGTSAADVASSEPEMSTMPSEPTPSTVEAQPLPIPYDETDEYRAVMISAQNDPLFGAMLLYVMGGD